MSPDDMGVADGLRRHSNTFGLHASKCTLERGLEQCTRGESNMSSKSVPAKGEASKRIVGLPYWL